MSFNHHPASISCDDEGHNHNHSSTDEEQSLEAEEVYDDDGNLISVGELVFVPGMEPLGVGSYSTVRLAHWKRSKYSQPIVNSAINSGQNHRQKIHLNTEEFTHLIRSNAQSNTQNTQQQTRLSKASPMISFGEVSLVSGDNTGHGDDTMNISCTNADNEDAAKIIPSLERPPSPSLMSERRYSRSIPKAVGSFGHFVVRMISNLGSSLLGDPMCIDTDDYENNEVDVEVEKHKMDMEEENHSNLDHDTIHPQISTEDDTHLRRGRFETIEDDLGKLVAVKILSKSILKRMRTLHRNPSTPPASTATSFERLSSSSASSLNNTTREGGEGDLYHRPPSPPRLYSSTSSSSTSYRVHVHTALQRVEQEIALMKLIRHPNIIALQHVIDSPESDALYMVLDFAPLGEIMTFDPATAKFHRRTPDSYSSEEDRIAAYTVEEGVVLPGRHFNEYHAALYFVDVMHGLAYLHQHHVCHRDLKPENILLEYNKFVGGGVAKITDFGVSHFFEEETSIGARRISWKAPNPNNDSDLGKTSTILSRSRSRDTTSDHEDSKQKLKKNSLSHRHHTKVLTRYDTDSALRMEGMAKIGRLRQTEGTWSFWSPEMCSMEGLGSNRCSDNVGGVMDEGDIKSSPPPELKKQRLRRQHSSFSGYASDLWAAGVCLYIFASGRTPFYSESPEELFSLISDGQVPYEGLGFSSQLVHLLENVLHKNPDERFGIGECLKHRFCRKARQQRIHSLGEELRRVSELELIVKAEDILNAFSIAKLADGAAKIFKEKHRMIQHKMSSDLLGLKRRLESTAPSSNEDASSTRKADESVNNPKEDQMILTDLKPSSSTSNLLMELGTFSNNGNRDDHDPGNTSCVTH